MSGKKLVVFADYGLDDACATAYLLDNRKRYENIDIVPIGGNVAVERAYANACKLLKAAGKRGSDLRGVQIVDTRGEPQPSHALPAIHGLDGMGDLFQDCEPIVTSADYKDWIAELGGDYEILSLGPCTMVVSALAAAKNLPRGDIMIMGGCTNEQPNFGEYEFNDALDHTAFVKLLSFPHAAATLDTCHNLAFDTLNLRVSEDTLLGTLVNRCTLLAEKRGETRNSVYDLVAAFALVNPDKFDARKISLPKDNVKVNELVLKENFSAMDFTELFF